MLPVPWGPLVVQDLLPFYPCVSSILPPCLFLVLVPLTRLRYLWIHHLLLSIKKKSNYRVINIQYIFSVVQLLKPNEDTFTTIRYKKHRPLNNVHSIGRYLFARSYIICMLEQKINFLQMTFTSGAKVLISFNWLLLRLTPLFSLFWGTHLKEHLNARRIACIFPLSKYTYFMDLEQSPLCFHECIKWSDTDFFRIVIYHSS